MALATPLSKALKIHITRELRMVKKEVGVNSWVYRKTLRICLVQENNTRIAAFRQEIGFDRAPSLSSSWLSSLKRNLLS